MPGWSSHPATTSDVSTGFGFDFAVSLYDVCVSECTVAEQQTRQCARYHARPQYRHFCLTESWHDADSVCLGRLRSAGYNVVDRPRPRTVDDLSVNHGGVVIFSATGVVMKPLTVDQPSTFELVCTRVVAGQLTAIVAAVYRPGSAPIQQLFFDELSTLLEQLATYQAPVYIVGDFNIHLDRPDDPHTVQFRLLVDCYSLMLHETAATHQLGGTLDAVVTREDVGCPDRVEVVDVGLSDHHLLQWSVDTTRPEVPTVAQLRRSWRRLDVDQFRCMLSSSSLCQPDNWPSDLDDMAAMYDHELNVLLDQLIPARSITCRRRPTDPWFDAECRTAKRLTRRLERAYAAARRHHNTNVGHMHDRQLCHICRRRLRCRL